MNRRRLGLATLATTLLAGGTAWAAFVPEGSPYPTGDQPYAVYAADFNGDGRPDLAVENGTSSDVNVYLRRPGGFAQESGSPVSVGAGSGPSYSAVADYNGDGRPDLAVANFVAGNVVTLLRQAGGGFAQESTPVGARLSAVGAGDFDGDQRPDLAVTQYDNGAVTILLRTDTGFTVQQSYQTGTNPRQIAVADFDRDGRLDLAIANESSANVTILRGADDAQFVPEATVAAGTRPAGIAAADFDGNGRPDLAVTNYTAGTVSVLLRGANGFAQEAGSPIAVAAGPVGVIAHDLDLDGRPDLAVASEAGTVTVLHRGAAGGFSAEPIALAGQLRGIAAADFDGDARPDLAVTSLANTMTILRNPAPVQPPPPPPPVPTPVPPAPTPTPLPPPVAGRSVNATPSGKVRIRLPGSKRFVDLTAPQQLPVGTSVDTRAGRITLLAAGKGGQADFYKGIFRIAQTKGARPLTTLKLTERLRCPKPQSRRVSAAAKRKKSRRLWGSGKGRFRTVGRYSAATVRGTRWLVVDHCRTTKTTVRQGSVRVRDKVKHRTVIVRKGKSYTARRKR